MSLTIKEKTIQSTTKVLETTLIKIKDWRLKLEQNHSGALLYVSIKQVA